MIRTQRKKYAHITEPLFKNIKHIEKAQPDPIKRSNLCITEVRLTLQSLREFVIREGFSSMNEEICFFRHVKPDVLALMVYHHSVLSLEVNMPLGYSALQKRRIKKEQKSIAAFTSRNKTFYSYVMSDLTYQDQAYFLRGEEQLSLIHDDSLYHIDPEFSTYHDVVLARIYGYEKYASYLTGRLANLGDPNSQGLPSLDSNFPYKWSASKMDLIELIYALHANNSIDGGSKPIKEIAEMAAYVFDVEVGNIYRGAIDLKIRKNPTQFLDQLKASLIKKLREN
ncbi:MAG: RteC domain-containing protein [Marinoscillum sp.]